MEEEDEDEEEEEDDEERFEDLGTGAEAAATAAAMASDSSRDDRRLSFGDPNLSSSISPKSSSPLEKRNRRGTGWGLD